MKIGDYMCTTRSQYVWQIVNEVVGKEVSRIDTAAPSYIAFREAHKEEGLSTDEVEDFDSAFQNQIQFASDFKWCFLGLYMDYCNKRISYPVRHVACEVIAELVWAHYPTQYAMILDSKVCRLFINRHATKFKRMLRSPSKFDMATFLESGQTPVDRFAGIYSHQLINVIAWRCRGFEMADVAFAKQPQRDANAGACLDRGRGLPDYTDILHGASAWRRSVNRTRRRWSMTALLVTLLAVYSVTGSIDPFIAHRANNVLDMAVVSTLVGLAALLLLRLLVGCAQMLSPLMRLSVVIGTGKPAREAICPSCGFSVFESIDFLGLPIVCRACRVAWHDGVRCYRGGMPPSFEILPSYPCPNCRQYSLGDSQS